MSVAIPARTKRELTPLRSFVATVAQDILSVILMLIVMHYF